MADVLHFSDADWKRRLTPEQYSVLRRKGTEPAFCGGYTASKHHGDGTYHCAGCGAALFSSDTKFDSGSGWPSFFQPIKGAVAEETDTSYGMERTEIHCARCEGHLGHVFNDGPAPTRLRYCINAVSLNFTPKPAEAAPAAASKPGADAPAAAEAPTAATPAPRTEHATFGAGCFWGVEADFREVKGVISTMVGYEGGTVDHPTYRQVCSDDTGHAETVDVVFDPAVVTYDQLLAVFWANHDPTTVNRQGPDVGTQYRSVVFFHSPEQQQAAEKSKAALDASGKLRRPVATQVVAATTFWPAEDYHQQYLEKRGLRTCHIK